jgi:hypothetical protein
MKRVGFAVAVVAVALAVVAPPAWAVYNVTPNCVVGGQTLPCGSGWYTSPVELYWTWSPAGGTATPGTCVTQSFAGDTVAEPSCEVTGSAGSGSGGQPINIEISNPTATVTPSRPPDSNGWYNHAVTATVNASAFSRIASCTSPSYSGLAASFVTFSATCVDNAGKTVTATSSPFSYDATPPSLTASAASGDGTVSLSWQTSGYAPIASISVVRSPGPSGAVYSGTAGGFQDTGLQDGVQYAYTVTAVDAAGNKSTQTVTATPEAHLVAPVNSALLASPPLLSWTPVRGATYYNVQLYRDGNSKVLSLWPTKAHLQLRSSWRYDGRRYRLKPGRYRWFVWPGFGKRRAARYGHMIGSWTFVVAR